MPAKWQFWWKQPELPLFALLISTHPSFSPLHLAFCTSVFVNVLWLRFVFQWLTQFPSHSDGPGVTSFSGCCSPTLLALGDLGFIGIQSVSELGLLQLPGPRWAGGEMTGWKWVVKASTAKRLMQLIFHYVQCLWIVISLDCSSSEAQIKCKWFLSERKRSLWGTVLFRAAKWLEINGDYEECFMNPPRRT